MKRKPQAPKTPDFSNEALFRAQAVEKERLARLPLATKLRVLKELSQWAGPLEEVLQEESRSRPNST